MSVAQTAERISKQAGNDVLTAFSGTWKIFSKTDLTCYKVNAAGVYTLGVVDVDYTVSFDTAAETWTVTWTVAPVTGGYSVVIGDAVPFTQASAFPREGVTPAATAKNALDKLTVLVQQLRDKLERVPIQPLTPVNPNNQITIATPVTRRALVYVITGSDVSIEPSAYDPDTLYNQSAVLAPSYGEGLAAARPAAPTVRTTYYSTDTDQLELYIPTAGRWFLLG
jgi:hypothetical protein